ncbi:MAG: CehA/McbA family metallohydrolase [Acidobacteriaceae bacterium]|nr:CehA/McbA family metallohydrolase [Acidobacteriaceae bacterium]MBV9502444.1 CehA/McbA family metallohydrolase [Acidobacteriaceae bacterium]
MIWIALDALTTVLALAQTRVPLQPFAEQVRQVESALAYLGEPLSPKDQDAVNQATAKSDEDAAISDIEQILDKYTLAIVEINPESRVRVRPGEAKLELVQAGTRVFLVKVINKAGVTARLAAESPNALPVYVPSDGSSEPPEKISTADLRDRWMGLDLYDRDPMSERLSGLPLEYRIVEIYSRDHGQRSAKIGFNVGQGTQDVGFRNEMVVLFSALPAHPLRLQVRDDTGAPSVAAFTIRDNLGRLYPNPSKRLAPDFFFQPQVYRANGETVLLPEGTYTVSCSMGPEYLGQKKQVKVRAAGPNEVSFAMHRWIDPAKYGWYSGDHHVHAAGCSHYQNPTEGVRPEDMVRQIRGEKLNVGAVLTWGPCYYYQKQFFSGKDNPLSTPDRLMHYDLEVSGFPSSHAGHLVLLGLKEQDYPHCVRIEQWPTWDLPILRWGKSQGALVGFAHSGWGLEVKSRELPNYEMPGFDGIGANEYIVDVTYPDTVDFISAVDTPYVWELNIWYHTLNVGFRTRISGETDFPCITDARVGEGRVYAKIDGPLTYSAWLDALRAGRSYVSDGRSHLMDFSVNNVGLGTNASELKMTSGGTVHARVKASAYLYPAGAADEEPNWMTPLNNPGNSHSADRASVMDIHDRPLDEEPYWQIERARVGNTRQVPIELVMNGKPVARKNVVADGSVQDIAFDVPVKQSSWLAVRILGSSHTNPMFILVNGKPIRASRQSAQWCLAAVNQCWTQKAPKISKAELPEAQAAYDHARDVYTKLVEESEQ